MIHPGNNSSQLLRQRKNFEILLRDHVFKIQNFHNDPFKLWQQFIPMLNILEIRQLKADGHIYAASKKIVKSFFSNPFPMLNYIMGKVNRRLKV